MRSIRTQGKKSDIHTDPDDPPRRRGNNRPGRGTYENERPPVFQIISRESGEVRVIVCRIDKTWRLVSYSLIELVLLAHN
jgi:transposase